MWEAWPSYRGDGAELGTVSSKQEGCGGLLWAVWPTATSRLARSNMNIGLAGGRPVVGQAG